MSGNLSRAQAGLKKFQNFGFSERARDIVCILAAPDFWYSQNNSIFRAFQIEFKTARAILSNVVNFDFSIFGVNKFNCYLFYINFSSVFCIGMVQIALMLGLFSVMLSQRARFRNFTKFPYFSSHPVQGVMKP